MTDSHHTLNNMDQTRSDPAPPALARKSGRPAKPVPGLVRAGAAVGGAIACGVLADWSGRWTPVAWGVSDARTQLLEITPTAARSLAGGLLVAAVAGAVVRWAGLGAGLLCLGIGLLARTTGPADSGVYGIQAAVLAGTADQALAKGVITGGLGCVGTVAWLMIVQKAAGAHLRAGRPDALPVGFGGEVAASLAAAALTTAACSIVGWFGIVLGEPGQVIGILALGYLFAGLAIRLILPKAGLAAMLLGPVIAVMVAGRLALSMVHDDEAFMAIWIAGEGGSLLRLATATPLQTLAAGTLGLGVAIIIAGSLEPAEAPRPQASGDQAPSNDN